MGKDNFNSSGATAPDLENAAKFRGENKNVVFTSCSSCFQNLIFIYIPVRSAGGGLRG